MNKIAKTHHSRLEVKKSVFIAYLCEFKNYKDLLQSLKKEHPKAVHFVYAYRYLNEHKQILEDKSDDFEPKNSAGLPCLNALRGAELVDTASIVLRYFGGIKLGVGGLVRAYTAAVNLAIQEAELLKFEFKDNLSLKINIKDFNKFKHECLKHDIVFNPSFNKEEVLIKLSVNEKEKNILKNFLSLT